MFEWDEEKRKANLAKHGVDFETLYDADWSNALIREDVRKDYGERRLRAFLLMSERLYVCVYTVRGEHFRIISLRKANDREIDTYENETD